MSGTFTIPTDLDAHFQDIARDRHVTVAEVVESALRVYIANNRRWGGREYRPATRPFEITPLCEKDDLGEPDVSVNHEKYLTEE